MARKKRSNGNRNGGGMLSRIFFLPRTLPGILRIAVIGIVIALIPGAGEFFTKTAEKIKGMMPKGGNS